MTTHTDLIARLREFGPCIAQDVQDALESLVQQVAALAYDVLHATEERDQKDKELAALTKDKEQLAVHLAEVSSQSLLRIYAAQARELKLRGVLDEAEKQLDLSQALLERSCHHHTILAAYKNVRTIREIPTDDSVLMERLKQERENLLAEIKKSKRYRTYENEDGSVTYFYALPEGA